MMSKVDEVAFLQADLGNLHRQLNAIGDRPSFKRRAIQHRIAEVQRELDQATLADAVLASGDLTFDGGATIGTKAIRAGFAAKALSAFEHLVSIAAATMNRNGNVNSRGLVAGQQEHRLFITGIARGSFGFHLEERAEIAEEGRQIHFFKSDLAQAMDSVLELMEAGADTSDDRFADAIIDSNDRVRKALRQFTETLITNETTCAFATGGKRFKFAEIRQIEQLRDRLADDNVQQERIELTGTLYTLPTDHRFELRDDDGEVWSGKAERSIPSDELAGYATKRVKIVAEMSVVGGQKRKTKRLLLMAVKEAGLSSPEAS